MLFNRQKGRTKMKRMAVLGAGVMGHGIAQIYAIEGYDVERIRPSANSGTG